MPRKEVKDMSGIPEEQIEKQEEQTEPLVGKKAENFVRLGEKRMDKAMKAISIIGTLASSNYEYRAEQPAKMKAVLLKQIEETFTKFGGKKPLEGFKF